MIIKNYLELNTNEKMNLCTFVNMYSYEKKGIEELDKLFAIKVNDFGYGSLFCIEEENILGSIQIVLEAAQMLGTIYIYGAKLLKSSQEDIEVLNMLIDSAKDVAKKYDAKEVMLGWGTEHIEQHKNIGHIEEYRAVKMRLDSSNTDYNGDLKLIKLKEDNKDKYFDVINKSFSDMPHGMYHYKKDIDGYIEKQDDNFNYFMVEDKGQVLGFINIEIENNKGCFDLGLINEMRGRGKGREILDLAIDYLIKKDVQFVELIVVKRNKRAYKLYKKRGFEEIETLGLWKVLISNKEELCLV